MGRIKLCASEGQLPLYPWGGLLCHKYTMWMVPLCRVPWWIRRFV